MRLVLRISDDQRRARLAIRHALAPAHRVDAIEVAAERVVALHATDPATIALSAWARTDGLHEDDLHRALYDDRTLVKHMAMRRTLFVFPRAILPAAQAGASERVATQERGRLSRDVERQGLHADGAAWLAEAEQAVVEALASGRLATAAELRAELPILSGHTIVSPGKSYGGENPVGPRVLTAASAAGKIVRAGNEGGWHVSRPRWAAMDDWLGEPLDAPSVDAGTAELVSAWLRAFGPGTANDLKWWLGSTVAAVKRALVDVSAVEVQLDHGEIGWVLPGDTGEIDDPGPWVALLPGLDPTIMGWQERAFYLGPHKEALFDRNGNAGPSIWADGRVIGGWRQDAEGRVELQLLDDPGRAARRALEAEAERLTDWLGGRRVQARFPSPLSKAT
jgi:Winged helix DNA-binding domain